MVGDCGTEAKLQLLQHCEGTQRGNRIETVEFESDYNHIGVNDEFRRIHRKGIPPNGDK